MSIDPEIKQAPPDEHLLPPADSGQLETGLTEISEGDEYTLPPIAEKPQSTSTAPAPDTEPISWRRVARYSLPTLLRHQRMLQEKSATSGLPVGVIQKVEKASDDPSRFLASLRSRL